MCVNTNEDFCRECGVLLLPENLNWYRGRQYCYECLVTCPECGEDTKLEIFEDDVNLVCSSCEEGYVCG